MARPLRCYPFALMMMTTWLRRGLALCSAVLLMAAAPKKSDSYQKITSPEVAARRLYDAWKKHDAQGARAFASDEAVAKLFSTKFRPLQAKGCDHVDEGFQCIYHDAAEDLFDVSFNVEGGASAGYNVTSVSFSTED
jgi:hypothetical protein